MVLVDNHGAERKFPLVINFIQTSSLSLRINKTQIPKVHKFKNVVTAKIYRISIFGEVEVRFNATLRPDLNLTNVNETVVDFYMLPSGRILD